MEFPLRASLDEIFSQLALTSPNDRLDVPRKILFWGEGAGEISSYAAGWMAGGGRDVIVLDGANRFDPYMVSSLARRALIPPEKLLERIRIARAFTCYQMATMIGERLPSLLSQEATTAQTQSPWVIVSGPITTFLDEDVPGREIHPLFERSLRKIEAMAIEGVPFFLFQSSSFPNSPFVAKGRLRGLTESRRAYLMRSLLQFSDTVWKICLDDKEPRVVMEKSPSLPTKSNVFPSPLMGEGPPCGVMKHTPQGKGGGECVLSPLTSILSRKGRGGI
jgi:hypothetical protein